MLLRVALFVVLALGIAGFGMVAWMSLRPSPASGPAANTSARTAILVAARPLRAGGLLKADDLAVRELPAATLPEGAHPDTPAARSELFGAMVRRSLAEGDALLPADVLRPGDHGFLAVVLAPGMRATTVGVDAVSGSAGLIWPGDRVDLILTQMQQDGGLPAAHRASAETVLTNARVIAIDQRLLQGATPGNDPPPARTVTLEVTPAQAERVAVAARLGHLSLAVRAAEPAGGFAASGRPAGPAAVTWGGDVSGALGGSAGNRSVLRLFLGGDEGKEFRF